MMNARARPLNGSGSFGFLPKLRAVLVPGVTRQRHDELCNEPTNKHAELLSM